MPWTKGAGSHFHEEGEIQCRSISLEWLTETKQIRWRRGVQASPRRSKVFLDENASPEPAALGQRDQLLVEGDFQMKIKIARNADVSSPAFLKNHKRFGMIIPEG